MMAMGWTDNANPQARNPDDVITVVEDGTVEIPEVEEDDPARSARAWELAQQQTAQFLAETRRN